MRATLFALSAIMAVACSAIPEVSYRDEPVDASPRSDAAAADSSPAPGTSSSGTDDSGSTPSGSSGSNGASSGSFSQTCVERQDRPDDRCCGDVPCWGSRCPADCDYCRNSCNAEDKRCCLHGSENKCLNQGERCPGQPGN